VSSSLSKSIPGVERQCTFVAINKVEFTSILLTLLSVLHQLALNALTSLSTFSSGMLGNHIIYSFLLDFQLVAGSYYSSGRWSHQYFFCHNVSLSYAWLGSACCCEFTTLRIGSEAHELSGIAFPLYLLLIVDTNF